MLPRVPPMQLLYKVLAASRLLVRVKSNEMLIRLPYVTLSALYATQFTSSSYYGKVYFSCINSSTAISGHPCNVWIRVNCVHCVDG